MGKRYTKYKTGGSSKRGGASSVAVVERQPREEMLELEEMWNRMRITEARIRGQQTKSAAWDESEALGIPASERRNNQISERELKDTYCKAYINMPWISSCIDARVLRMVSGTWELVATEENADESVRDEILELLNYVNDDEDLMQLLYSYGLDVMIYGEGYLEVVRGGNGKPANQPTQLHKVDCPTMTYTLDEHGKITGYEQKLTHSTKPMALSTDQIMRTWFPSPESSKKPLSPIAKLLGAAMLYEQMMDWARKFFKKGARPPFSFKHPGDKRKAEDFLIWLKENFTGPQNAHVPLLTYDGVETEYAPQGTIELDFLRGLEWVRQETMSNLQTPPANIAVIESGNIGGGTGDSQQKTFVNNAVKPLERLILEKFNFFVIQKGFKTKQWKLVLRPASYEDDAKTSEVHDRRIRNGTLLPNESRRQMGDAPFEDCGDTPIFDGGKEIMPLRRLDDLDDEQTQSAQLDLQTKKAQADLAQTQAKKAKEPPKPIPAPLQQAQNGDVPPNGEEGKPPQDNKNSPNDKNGRESFLDICARLFLEKEIRDHLHLVPTDPNFVPVYEAYNYLRGGNARAQVMDLLAQRAISSDWPILLKEATEQYGQQQSHDQSQSQSQTNTQGGSHDEEPVGNGTSQKESGLAAGTLRPHDRAERQEPTNNAGDIAEAHTGVMIAFMLDPDVAQQLAVPGGEPAEDMHITLAYLPDAPDYTPEQLTMLKQLVAAYAQHAAPLEGILSGVGRFNPSDSSDGLAPYYATPNVHGLHELRDELVHQLLLAGYNVAHDFAYTPHITLTYVDANAPMVIMGAPDATLKLHTLCLVNGDERTYYKLIGEQSQHTAESSLTDPPDTGAWQDGYPGIQATLDDYTARGVVELEWDASGSACDQCQRNHGKRVKVGEAFPTGAYVTPQHGGCQCVIKEIMADGSIHVGYGAGTSLGNT